MARERSETDVRRDHDPDRVHLVESIAGTVFSGIGDDGVGEVIAITITGHLNIDGEPYRHTYALDLDDIALLLIMLRTGAKVIYGPEALAAAMDYMRHELEVSGLLDPDGQDMIVRKEHDGV